MAKAANSVIARIATFYVGSIFLLAVILPWNDETVAASPFVAAFTKMGIPYADHIMNAVVLTAVLSCLNSGMYTASRMLFVLAARREAPLQLVKVTKRGVPAVAILASSVVGFLCVVAAAVSPDTIFAFLLNSSGAIILFVYCLIGISQVILRHRSGSEGLRVKMWLFPGLSIFTVVAIAAILAQMGLQKDSRSQLILSLLSWAVVIALFFANRWFIARRPDVRSSSCTGAAAGARAGRRDGRLDRAARRAARHRCGPRRALLRVVPAARSRPRRRHARAARCHGGDTRGRRDPLEHTLMTLRSENLRLTVRSVTSGRCGPWPTRSTPSARIRSSSRPCRSTRRCGTASTSSTAPAASTRPAGHPRGRDAGARRNSPMTIIAGFSSSRQGSAPLNLATQLARTTGEKVLAAAVRGTRAPGGDRSHRGRVPGVRRDQAAASLEQVVDRCHGDADIATDPPRRRRSPTADGARGSAHADLVVVGSSSSGLLGRVALGSVTERLVQPRGCRSPSPRAAIRRVPFRCNA